MKKLNRKQVLNVILETLLKEEEEKTKARADISKMNLGPVESLVKQYYDDSTMAITNAYLETIRNNAKTKKDQKVEDNAYQNLIKLIDQNPDKKKEIIDGYKKIRSELKPLNAKSRDYLKLAKIVDS